MQMQIPQTQIVTARIGSIYLKDGVLIAAPIKNAAERAVKIHETVATDVPNIGLKF
jgi:hypothetical protein